MKKAAGRRYAVLLALALLGILELIAWAFFARFEARFPFPDPGRYRPSEAVLAQAERLYDPELGWVPPYGTPFGERPRAVDRGRPLIAAFGDSFTHGDEVEHTETWPEHLGRLLDGDVFNFGGSAYGMDQMLLRFERDFPRRPAPLAVLAFISVDIQRNLSVYRRFMSTGTDFPFTKPRFVVEDDRLRLLPNPAPTLEALRAGVRDEAFLARIGRDDFWYRQRHGMPRRAFPHLRLLFHPRVWRAAAEEVDDRDLWRMPAPRRLAELILLRFAAGARDAGAEPVIVHLPIISEIRALLKDGSLPPAVAATEAFCADHGLRCLMPLRALADTKRDAVGRLFARGQGGGHYSDAGNRFVAGYLAARLPTATPPRTADAPHR